MGWEDSVWELQRQRCPLSITVLPASFICLVVLLHHTLFSSGVNVDLTISNISFVISKASSRLDFFLGKKDFYSHSFLVAHG